MLLDLLDDIGDERGEALPFLAGLLIVDAVAFNNFENGYGGFLINREGILVVLGGGDSQTDLGFRI